MMQHAFQVAVFSQVAAMRMLAQKQAFLLLASTGRHQFCCACHEHECQGL